jgi:hypothetical protein
MGQPLYRSSTYAIGMSNRVGSHSLEVDEATGPPHTKRAEWIEEAFSWGQPRQP